MSSFISCVYRHIHIHNIINITMNRQKNGLIGLLDHTVLTIEIDSKLLRKERGLIMLSCPQHDDELVDSVDRG